MADEKNRAAANKATLHEAAADYHTIPANISIAIPLNGFGEANYIRRSVVMLGAAAIKPFSQVQSNADFIGCIRAGLPRKALDVLMKFTGITIDEITGIIRTSDRTLRRYTPQQKLNAEQTERLIEIARLYSRGEEVFSSLEAFKEWMNSTVLALGNKKPKSFLDTSLGIEILMNELGRIEHGIFA